MKDKLKSGGDAIKSLIETGGHVAEKVIEKGTDVTTGMMNNITGLISKLSDDIGMMADRILTTEEKIGQMADRIVKTEELMAKLTASLAGKNLDPASLKPEAKGAPETAVLSTDAAEASMGVAPRLTISGNPQTYLLCISTSPLFRDGSTVISRVSGAAEYDAAWKRSMIAVKESANDVKKDDTEATVISIAVRTIAEDNGISPLSNSIDVRVHV